MRKITDSSSLLVNNPRHIYKSLVRSDILMYEARAYQIKRHIKRYDVASPGLNQEYEELKSVLSWYDEKKKQLHAAFPKSKLYDTGSFQPHKDLCLFIPLAGFNAEQQIDEHLAKMIFAYMCNVRISRKEHERFYTPLLEGLNKYFNIELAAEDVFYFYDSINSPDFYDKLIQFDRKREIALEN